LWSGYEKPIAKAQQEGFYKGREVRRFPNVHDEEIKKGSNPRSLPFAKRN
jgi:hypothetical protein